MGRLTRNTTNIIMSETIDIKDFREVSQIYPLDSILLSQSGSGEHAKIKTQLLIDAILRHVSDGKAVNLRNQGGKIEWQHEGDGGWQELVPLEAIKGSNGDKGDDGKTPKLVSINASAGEAAQGSITKSGDDSQGNPEYSINLTLPRGQRGDDGDDGKTPRFEVGTVSTLDPSQSATATVRYIGVHTDGSPKYAIDMSIPRGAAGSLGQGDAKDLSVTFSEALERSPLLSGTKMAVLFGLVKRWFSDLKAIAFSGRFSDLLDKPTTLQGYGIMNGANINHTHDLLDFFDGVNTVTSLSNLPTTKQVVSVTLERPSTLSINGTLSEGRHLLVGITPTNDFTLPIPNSGSFVSMDGASVSCKAGQRVELSILRVSGKNIIKVSTSK